MTADKNELCYDEAVENFFAFCSSKEEVDRLFSEAAAEVTAFFEKLSSFSSTSTHARSQTYFMLGCAARMLLSAVVDADRRSTAEFMSGRNFELCGGGKDYFSRQLEFFNGKIGGLKSDTPINAARNHFSEICREAASRPSGLYRLTLPTGGGKTLSALRYSLCHAAQKNKKRIIFVIPLLSILDQNSAVIRDYLLPDSIVTEHHSDFLKPTDEDELDTYELLTETWESPVIITTLFQLLNTLFTHKMSSVRRMSALSDSVIVIDEIQSLPVRTMNMFCTAVNFLSNFCGADIVLSSATQPSFDDIRKYPLIYSEKAEIVPYEKEYFDIFKRTEVIDRTVQYGMTVEELADFSLEIVEEVRSLLVICNTKRSAAALFHDISSRTDCETFFLSADMCMAHRKDVLACINSGLLHIQNGGSGKLICVSTQLVEAGVDFSFESVVRVIAGIDNAAQAAGRCNRSNEYGKICKVYLVNLRQDFERLSMLKEIAAAQRCTRSLLSDYLSNSAAYENDLLGSKAVCDFYGRLYKDSDIDGQFDYPCDGEKLYDLLSYNGAYRKRSKYILNQSFRSAGEKFKVFDENTTDVIVPYNSDAKEIIADLCSLKADFDIMYVRRLLERAKPYIIRLFEYQRRSLSDEGMLYSCADGRALCLNELRYDSRTGLITQISELIL